MEWKPWLYTPVLGMALIQGVVCTSWSKDLFVFNCDKWSGPQNQFRVTQTLGLICNAFQAWKSFWWNGVHVSSVQSVSHVWLFVTHEPQHSRPPCPSPTPGGRSNSYPSSRWCHLILCRPLLLRLQSFPASGSLKWVSSLHRVAKVLEFQLQHQSFQWTPRLICFRMGWLDLLAVQGTLKSLLQHHSSKASILQRSDFFGGGLVAKSCLTLATPWTI